jgi:hypothetical protein
VYQQILRSRSLSQLATVLWQNLALTQWKRQFLNFFGCPGAAAPSLPGLSRRVASRRPRKLTAPSARAFRSRKSALPLLPLLELPLLARSPKSYHPFPSDPTTLPHEIRASAHGMNCVRVGFAPFPFRSGGVRDEALEARQSSQQRLQLRTRPGQGDPRDLSPRATSSPLGCAWGTTEKVRDGLQRRSRSADPPRLRGNGGTVCPVFVPDSALMIDRPMWGWGNTQEVETPAVRLPAKLHRSDPAAASAAQGRHAADGSRGKPARSAKKKPRPGPGHLATQDVGIVQNRPRVRDLSMGRAAPMPR